MQFLYTEVHSQLSLPRQISPLISCFSLYPQKKQKQKTNISVTIIENLINSFLLDEVLFHEDLFHLTHSKCKFMFMPMETASKKAYDIDYDFGQAADFSNISRRQWQSIALSLSPESKSKVKTRPLSSNLIPKKECQRTWSSSNAIYLFSLQKPSSLSPLLFQVLLALLSGTES